MNWEELENDVIINGVARTDLLAHWRKLGSFRSNNPSVGAGRHSMISRQPYIFSRSFNEGSYNNSVVVGLDLNTGLKKIPVSEVFNDGEAVSDAYSNREAVVQNGMVEIDSPYDIVLLQAM